MSDLEDFNFSEKLSGQNSSEDEEEFDIIDNSIFKTTPKSVHISDKVDVAEVDAETEVSYIPLTLEQSQHQNRDILNSHIVFLHPRGVLLVGSVMSATFENGDAEIGNGASDILFKVLFVEGGTQPAMFRCKTPIYTSSAVQFSAQGVRWRENPFRFDMIMPDEGKGFNIYGEIVVSIYRIRITGGNDLIGQATFDLTKMSKSGSLEHFQDDVEGRSLSGKYSLLVGNRVVGEVEVQLNIAWKANAEAVADDDYRPKNSIEQEKARVSKLDKSKNLTSRPKSAGGGGGGVTTKFVVPPQRKIVSKQAKKQKEDALRIEKENKLLASKIQKHKTHGELAYNTGDAKSVVAQLQYGVTNEQAYIAEAKETARMVHEKQKKAPYNDMKVAHNSNGDSVNRLYTIFTQFKRDIAEEEDAIKALKGKLNNLNIHIKKYSSNIQRLRQNPMSTVPVGKVSISLKSEVGEVARLVQESEDQTVKTIHPQNSLAPDSAAQPKRLSTPSEGEIICVENNYPITDTCDAEYKSVKEEYDILQKIRRALIERIHVAKKICGNVDIQSSYIDAKRNLVKSRLLHMADELGPYFVNEDLALDSKMSFRNAGEERDFLVYSKHRSLQEEINLLEITASENPERFQIMSARHELKAVIEVLKDKIKSSAHRVEELQVRKRCSMSELKHKLEDNSQFRVRQQITTMLGIYKKLQSQQRQELIINGTKECEMQLLRLQYRAKEREKLGLHPELLLNNSNS